MCDKSRQTPLLSLLSLLTTAIHTIESELEAAQMPTFTLEPKWHPLDAVDAVPGPRLTDARKVALASANMIKALVQDVGTALADMSTKTVDTASYILTADIGLVDVFETDEEKSRGLSVEEMVSRLPEGKKTNPQKLARCLRLLSAEHWWTEPSPGTFAPTRWALINTRGSPTWAFHSPLAWSIMVGSTMFTEYMTNPATMDTHDIDSAPFVLGWHKLGNTQDRNYWEWMQREPEKFARFALAMEGMGYLNIASIKADYPWSSLPPNCTFVDVGSATGSVALHVLKHIYSTVPTLRVVLQDYESVMEAARKHWAQAFPQALTDGRVEFEIHDIFHENPQRAPNTIYWLRWVLHDWQDNHAVSILKNIRAVCDPTSKVLIAEYIICEGIPSQLDGRTDLERTFNAVDNSKPYEPIPAPYPLPQNFGYASKVANQHDLVVLTSLNSLERTLRQFEKIIDESGFKLAKVYPTRGQLGILELVPN